MDMWTTESLRSWGKTNGYKTRPLPSGKGVMFHLPTSTKAVFTIYLSPNDGNNAVEVAFNINQFPEARNLLDNLKESYQVAPPNKAHKWPRVGSKTFDARLLTMLTGT